MYCSNKNLTLLCQFSRVTIGYIQTLLENFIYTINESKTDTSNKQQINEEI